ncbi:MAG: hypothetical protein LBE36_04260, partial [Flavobacteriaceae bacterium]|jgi:hypothetical protein|nr:hypothetical protein [Flavobacteriaceae bacterium]
MKNILIILSLVLAQLGFAQEYPLDYKDDVPNGAYYKDMTEIYRFVERNLGRQNPLFGIEKI